MINIEQLNTDIFEPQKVTAIVFVTYSPQQMSRKAPVLTLICNNYDVMDKKSITNAKEETLNSTSGCHPGLKNIC